MLGPGLAVLWGAHVVPLKTFNFGDDVTALPPAPIIRPGRISESPLSDIDEHVAAEVEVEHQQTINSALYEPEDDTEQSVVRKAAQRARRLRLLQPDSVTTLSNAQIKEQSHDKILRPLSFLPRDPELLALIEMQENDGLVSEWAAVPRHHHPTRSSDVLEEDERSRTSASQVSRTRGD
ncbi:hypothetical protein L207DRAFT_592935 [Hyaloscypha variabilis F]|uniref:Uncharacterized protein n=1 Tax=Hyaloscypha variabilis (strain UAMH 11265 / GT02V1 / F) TaxID=1149755 RepID=A0A2J6QUF2_HYAVF|nr:hypothetical protein L207DRAFT_592935 [Hyaloscypha variabilis F]